MSFPIDLGAFRMSVKASAEETDGAFSLLEGYFDELSEPLKTGRVEDDVLSAIAEKYSIEVVGPTPKSYA